jgi:Bacterial Ig domain
MRSVWLYIVFLLFTASACRKNKDNVSPVISISSPLQNSTVTAGNYIHLKAKVTDDKKLEYVRFKLLNTDGVTQIAEPIEFSVSGNELIIDELIQVGDLHTITAMYQIIIEAFDGTNKKKAYWDINVTEIPKSFKKMIAIRDQGTSFSVDSLAGSFFVPFISGSSDFSNACLSNYYQHLYIAGRTNGVLSAYNLYSNNISWTVPSELPSSTLPIFYFNEYDLSDGILYQSMASATNGKLKAISHTGTATKIYTMQAGHYANCMGTTINHVIVGETSVAGSTHYISYYFKTGFGLDFITSLPMKPKKIFVLSENEIVVIGNNGSQGELRIYDSNTNGLWEQVDIPAGKIYDALQYDANTYLIAHETGILKFEHSPTNLITLVAGDKAQCITINPVNGLLYAGVGSLIKGYHPITGAAAGGYSCADSVRAILYQFNK